MGGATSEPTIVFGVDRRYLGPLLVALTSLATDGGIADGATPVSVLHTDLTPDDIDALSLVGARLGVDVEAIHLEPEPGRFPVSDWTSDAAYLRLRLEAGARGSSRVLYLDCDLVALRPLGPLLSTELRATVAAVQDVSNPILAGGEGLPGWEQLGLPGERQYFNSGVMVVDVDRWVEERIPERCASFLVERSEHVRFWDQCALNFVFDDVWDRLPLEWNSLPLSTYMPALAESYAFEDVIPLEEALAAEGRANVLHFAGPFKPWYPSYPERAAGHAYQRFLGQLEEVLDAPDVWAHLFDRVGASR